MRGEMPEQWGVIKISKNSQSHWCGHRHQLPEAASRCLASMEKTGKFSEYCYVFITRLEGYDTDKMEILKPDYIYKDGEKPKKKKRKINIKTWLRRFFEV